MKPIYEVTPETLAGITTVYVKSGDSYYFLKESELEVTQFKTPLMIIPKALWDALTGESIMPLVENNDSEVVRHKNEIKSLLMSIIRMNNQTINNLILYGKRPISEDPYRQEIPGNPDFVNRHRPGSKENSRGEQSSREKSKKSSPADQAGLSGTP